MIDLGGVGDLGWGIDMDLRGEGSRGPLQSPSSARS